MLERVLWDMTGKAERWIFVTDAWPEELPRVVVAMTFAEELFDDLKPNFDTEHLLLGIFAAVEMKDLVGSAEEEDDGREEWRDFDSSCPLLFSLSQSR